MVNIPLGKNAYKRTYAGEPEIILQNRYVEKDPSNLVEGTALITRPGSDSLVQAAGGTIRGNYSKLGLFNGDLLTVSGHNLWRIDSVTAAATQITGTIAGDNNPYLTWMKGIGYEYVFISDASTLRYAAVGDTALTAVTGMGGGELPKALATVSGFVLVSVANSQKVYFIEPGAVVIDPLNFFEKESAPDNVLDMLTVGDHTLIMGNGSTESWYATSDFNAPFAPIKGRVYARGIVEGTPVLVDDTCVLVGNDGKVYTIGDAGGEGGYGGYGVQRISTNGIEERIRTQLRMEQGFTP
jgi:hypothetical protein